ncbi:hypothetical protein [Streptomyces sp. SID8352]|uniref:hypothetical protein n=1 Tax=Streptomyces sp. SID8352 TaxID=2690338 RepID=UPI00136DEEDB|nr:hypothetical protein [Streptomyces sp. SID8352]MYU25970.1 hypothetical protein [Streptomyces sp. SID8352]
MSNEQSNPQPPPEGRPPPYGPPPRSPGQAPHGAPGPHTAPYGTPYGGVPPTGHQPPYGGMYPPAPYPPYGPYTMPGTVRAAQIVIWSMGGLVLMAILAGGYDAGPRVAGALFGTNLMGWALCVLAFFYPSHGDGVRITSMVLAGVQIVMSVAGLTGRLAGVNLALLGSVALLVLLNQGTAKRWFLRPRGPLPPYRRP